MMRIIIAASSENVVLILIRSIISWRPIRISREVRIADIIKTAVPASRVIFELSSTNPVIARVISVTSIPISVTANDRTNIRT